MDKTKLWIEETFTKVPNNIMKLLLDTRHPTDSAILTYVIRLTCGFSRKCTNRLLNEDFAPVVHVQAPQISKRINVLLKKGVLFRGDRRGKAYKYSLYNIFSEEKGISSGENKISLKEKFVSQKDDNHTKLISQQETIKAQNEYKIGVINLGNLVNKVFKERNEIKSINQSDLDSFNQPSEDFNECQRKLIEYFDISIDIDIKLKAIKKLCMIKQNRRWCTGEDGCQHDLDSVATKIAIKMIKNNDIKNMEAYVMKSIENYLNECGEELSKEAHAYRRSRTSI